MNTLTRILSTVSLTMAISSCGFFASMADIESQSSATSDALEKDLGERPLIGWRLNNGTLTNVNVTFSEGKVNGLSIAELETHVRAAVSANFKLPPRQLVISISIKP